MLVLSGIALAATTGCEAESDDASDAPLADEGVTEKTASAVVGTYYDFIANAPGASWHNNDTGLPWLTDDTRGSCYTTTGVLENGVNTAYLFTQPKPAANGFMHAAYTVTIPPASLNPSVTATFGFKQGASATDGVKFALTTQVDGAWVSIFSETKTYTGTLTTKTASLTAYAGKTITLFLTADAGATATADLAAWTDFRLVADTGGVPNGGCTIGGVNYESGASNPAVSCQVCEPTESTSAWSIKPDSCLIADVCYSANATDSGRRCKMCDPQLSKTGWSPRAACESLVVGTTSVMNADTDPDAACAAKGSPLGFPGTWKAIVSKQGVRDLRDTVPTNYASTLPVVNIKGQQLYSSWNAIFTNQVWPAGLDLWLLDPSYIEKPAGTASFGPSRGKLYTGSGVDGRWLASSDGNNCQNWTSLGTGALWWWDPYTAEAGDSSPTVRKLVSAGVETRCDPATSGSILAGVEPAWFACVLVPPAEPQITIENYDGSALGPIKGKAQGETMAYLKLPYAAPPTGNLRLAPPAKATSWTAVRDATAQSAPCAQPPLLPTGGMIGSEDCLYLNVWTPKTATPTSNLPVLVFHHGGAHMFGGTRSSADWLATGFLDGDRFAASQNAVVVTIQSRIGPLGYLTDAALAADSTSRTSTVGGGTSGNYGLLDTIQALRWVKRNISKFGGDPTKVAFSGESSGSTMVCDLLASPLAKDPADNQPYFTRAIMESGFCEGPSVAYRQAQATTAISSIGCSSAPDKVACLRAAPLQSFVNVEGTILGFFPDMFATAIPPERAFGLTWGPHIDGYVLPQQPRISFAAGTHNKMPVIVGTNKEEAMFVMLFMVGGILTGDLPNLIVLAGCGARNAKLDINLTATLANSVKTLYGCDPLDLLSPTKSFAAGVTHAQYECPARRTARALDIGQTQAVRRYWFTHRADNLAILHNLFGLVRDIGAAHSFELQYIFNTHGTVLWYYPTTRERNLTTALQSYWRSFANSGDPNYSGGVNWPAYDRTIDNTLKLEVTGAPGGIQTVNGIDTAQCDFWDNNFTLDGWK